jgi:ABC-type uncharacterized transport system permease subunit
MVIVVALAKPPSLRWLDVVVAIVVAIIVAIVVAIIVAIIDAIIVAREG